jgi:iron complex outermembrane recepter protein
MNNRLAVAAVAALAATAALVSGGALAQSASNAKSSDVLEEVIVTAQHEAQELTRTPVAITAVTGADLAKEGITSTAQLSGMVPNVSIDKAGDQFITIRGVTSNDATEKGDPSAAFMMDGVYIARPQAQDVSFFDINRVEVLRGPQGTLWGRNTTAGLIHLISNLPEHKDAASLNITYGNYNTLQADGVLNVDTGEHSAVRAAFAFDKRNEFYHATVASPFDLNPLRNNMSFRLTGLFDLSDKAKLTLRGDYSALQGSATGDGGAISNAYDLTDSHNPVRKSVSTDTLLGRPYPLNDSNRINNSTWGLGAELSWDLGPVALSYVGSYRALRREENGDLALAVFGFAAKDIFFGKYWQNSQEFRVATTGDGPFKAQGGIYYFKERSGIELALNNFAGRGTYGFPQDPTISESYAAFGQGTYSFTPAVRLTAGVRYTHDNKSRDGATINNVNPGDLAAHWIANIDCNVAPGKPGGPPAATSYACLNWAERQYSKTTGRLALEADVAPDTMLYGSVATGYKAGGFGDGCEAGAVDPRGVTCNQSRDATSLYYNPENLTAYEIGLKGKVGGAFRYSTGLFYYDYTDLQLSSLGNIAGAPSLVTTNAGKASVTGLELEGSLKIDAHQRLDGSATYTDAKYEKYLAYISTTAFIDYKGKPLDRAPKETVALAYSITQPVTSGGEVEYRLAGRYSASYTVTNFSAVAQFVQPSYFKGDASVTYTGSNGKWSTRAYVRNFTNEVTLTNLDGFGNMFVSEPRTFGIGMGLKF